MNLRPADVLKDSEKHRLWTEVVEPILEGDPETRELNPNSKRSSEHRKRQKSNESQKKQNQAKVTFEKGRSNIDAILRQITFPPKFPRTPSNVVKQGCINNLTSSLTNEDISVCTTCDQFSDQCQRIRFDPHSIFWNNILRTCKAPTTLPATLVKCYSVFDTTGIEELENILLSKRGVLWQASSSSPYSWAADDVADDSESEVDLSEFLDITKEADCDSSPAVDGDPDVESAVNLDELIEIVEEDGVLQVPADDLRMDGTLPSLNSPPGTPHEDLDSVDLECDLEFLNLAAEDAKEIPLFAFCKRCFKYYGSANEVHTPSKDSIANGHYYGTLPPEIQSLLKDTVKILLAPMMPITQIKTYHIGPNQTQKLRGSVLILDIGLSLAHVVQGAALGQRSDRLRVLMHPNLPPRMKNDVRMMERATMQDLETALGYFVNECGNPWMMKATIDIPYIKQELSEEGMWLDPVEEIAFQLPETHTNVLGETPPETTLRFYSLSSETGDEALLAGEKLSEGLPQETSTNTLSITPGNRFASLEKDGVFQRLFPWLFPFGHGPINPNRPVKTSVLYEIRRLLRTRLFDKDFTFIACCFSYLKQKQISNAICFKASTMEPRTVNRILAMKPEDIKKDLESLRSTRSTRSPLVQPVNASIGSAHGTDGERLRMRQHAFATASVFGAWTWFLSFSPGVENNDLLFRYRQRETSGPGNDSIPSKAACQALTAQVTNSVEFMHKFVDTILQDMLGWDLGRSEAKPDGGMLGIPEAIAVSYETNSRGRLHVHMLVRIKDTPRSKEDFLRELRANPKQFQHRVVTYLEETLFSDYDFTLEECVCPGCKISGTFLEYRKTSQAYSSVKSRTLSPLVNVTCSNPECNLEWCSNDVVRQTAVQNLAECLNGLPMPLVLSQFGPEATEISNSTYDRSRIFDLVRAILFQGGPFTTKEFLNYLSSCAGGGCSWQEYFKNTW